MNFIPPSKTYFQVLWDTFVVCFYRVKCQALATGFSLAAVLPLHCIVQPAGGGIVHPFTWAAASIEWCVSELLKLFVLFEALFIPTSLLAVIEKKHYFYLVSHCRTLCCQGVIIQYACPRWVICTGVAPIETLFQTTQVCAGCCWLLEQAL